MSNLLIDQLTGEAGLNKTAEEANMEKLAEEIHALDHSRTLICIGEEMMKIAESLDNESLGLLAADTYRAGERMGLTLVKTASESDEALNEALELAADMSKIAEVYSAIAEEVSEEEMTKMACAIIEISNELTDDANEFYKMAGWHNEGSDIGRAAEKAGDEATTKKPNWFKRAGKYGFGKGAWTAEEARALAKGKGGLKRLLLSKPGLKALGRPGIAYGSAAAALAGAGYGAKKAYGKKK